MRYRDLAREFRKLRNLRAGALLLLAGCATDFGPDRTEAAAEWPAHVVLADIDGTALDPFDIANGCVVNSVPRPPEWPLSNQKEVGRKSIEAAVTRLVGEARKHSSEKPLRVIVFIHGGLNDVPDGCQRVYDQSAQIVDEHGLDDESTYPIFLIWPAGGAESYGDEIAEISEGERHNSPLERGLGIVRVAADPLAGLARSPRSAVLQGRQLYRHSIKPVFSFGSPTTECTNPRAQTSAEAVCDTYNGEPFAEITKNNNIMYEPGNGQSLRTSILDYTLTPLLFPFRIVGTPFADGYGVPVWQNLKRRAFTAVRMERKTVEPNNGETVNTSSICGNEQNDSAGAFGLFFCELQKQLLDPEKDPSQRLITLDIVGHSMGAIILNEVLWEFPKLKVDNVVYMAGAASLQNWARTALPYLREHTKTRIWSLHLNPHNEATEDMFLLPVIPRGSLLNWVDNMYEPTNRLTDKTMGSWTNMRRYHPQIDEDLHRRIVFKVFGDDDTMPVRHGEFGATPTEGGKRFAWWRRADWGDLRLWSDSENVGIVKN